MTTSDPRPSEGEPPALPYPPAPATRRVPGSQCRERVGERNGSEAGVGAGRFSWPRKVWAVVRKDLTIELRSRDVLSSAVVFTLLVLLIFNFALDLTGDAVAAVAPGVLWVTFVFAGMLTLGRTFARESERDALQGLLLAPLDRGGLYVAKLLVNLALLGLVELVALPAFAALYNLQFAVGRLLVVTFLGTLGFAAVGTLFAAVAANTRAREALLPLLLFPILVPVIIGAVKATGESLAGAARDGPPWLGLLAAFDVIFLALSYVVFEYVLEE